MKKDKLSINLEKSDFPDVFPQLWIKLGNNYGTFAITFGRDEVRLVSWLNGKKVKVVKKTKRY